MNYSSTRLAERIRGDKENYPFKKGMCFTGQKGWHLEFVLNYLLLNLLPISSERRLRIQKNKALAMNLQLNFFEGCGILFPGNMYNICTTEEFPEV